MCAINDFTHAHEFVSHTSGPWKLGCVHQRAVRKRRGNETFLLGIAKAINHSRFTRRDFDPKQNLHKLYAVVVVDGLFRSDPTICFKA